MQLQTAREEGIFMALEKELATYTAKLPDRNTVGQRHPQGLPFHI
jgi:hypothetical protein